MFISYRSCFIEGLSVQMMLRKKSSNVPSSQLVRYSFMVQEIDGRPSSPITTWVVRKCFIVTYSVFSARYLFEVGCWFPNDENYQKVSTTT